MNFVKQIKVISLGITIKQMSSIQIFLTNKNQTRNEKNLINSEYTVMSDIEEDLIPEIEKIAFNTKIRNICDFLRRDQTKSLIDEL